MKSDQPTMKYIQAGGGGIVPQMDAPTSASNSGERRVTIRCLQSSISLPVTLDTSPLDILYSAANLMTHKIDPQSSIVYEHYFSFGLERPLRRYERIRDILNSWERDSQHSLLIASGSSSVGDLDLNIESVPKKHQAPSGFVNFPLYHCQRPGRWNKRLVTLLDSGQMFLHKKPGAKPSDKESILLCNLSDFDLYDVTDRDTIGQLRPPKSNLAAVKSQQKNSVFLSTDNFIHFFSTDDVATLQRFRTCIHSWRSWYLVNKKVDLVKQEKAKQRNGSSQPNATKSEGIARMGHRRLKVSVDETPYTIGTFEPLLDMNRFDKPIEDFGQDFLPEERSSNANGLVGQARGGMESTAGPGEGEPVITASSSTPVQSPKSTRPQEQRVDVFGKGQEFKASSLLGKGYEGRKQYVDRAPDQPPTGQGPFTGGLLEKQEISRRPTTRRPERSNTTRQVSSPPESRHLNRAKLDEQANQAAFTGGLLQQLEKPAPALDTAPKSPEVLSHWRDGFGHGVRAPAGMPLISMATDTRTGYQPQGSGTMPPSVVLPLSALTRRSTTKTTKSTQSNPVALARSRSRAASSSRPRSQSTTTPAGRRHASHEHQATVPAVPAVPAIPPLPMRPANIRPRQGNDEDVPLINFVDRPRGRDATPAGVDMRKRSGTLRY